MVPLITGFHRISSSDAADAVFFFLVVMLLTLTSERSLTGPVSVSGRSTPPRAGRPYGGFPFVTTQRDHVDRGLDLYLIVTMAPVSHAWTTSVSIYCRGYSPVKKKPLGAMMSLICSRERTSLADGEEGASSDIGEEEASFVPLGKNRELLV